MRRIGASPSARNPAAAQRGRPSQIHCRAADHQHKNSKNGGPTLRVLQNGKPDAFVCMGRVDFRGLLSPPVTRSHCFITPQLQVLQERREPLLTWTAPARRPRVMDGWDGDRAGQGDRRERVTNRCVGERKKNCRGMRGAMGKCEPAAGAFITTHLLSLFTIHPSSVPAVQQWIAERDVRLVSLCGLALHFSPITYFLVAALEE